MSPSPLNTVATDELLARKAQLEGDAVRLAKRIGMKVDYAFAMMHEARSRSLGHTDHVVLLEILVEIEAIKYTLLARRLREMGEE